MNADQLFHSHIDEVADTDVRRQAMGALLFKPDWNVFSVKDKRMYITEQPSIGFEEKSNDVFVNKIKLLVKKLPWLFHIIYHIVGASFLGKNPEKALKGVPLGKVVLNLGSGVTSLRDDIINIDFYPFENVHMVGDIANLPFVDNSADGVVCEYVLEHVPDPTAIVREIKRVSKPGAIVYISVPFNASFHSAPHDYYRWSKMGLREEMKDFEEIECGVRSGPGAAVDYLLAEYIATVFCFGFKKLHQVLFMIFLVLLAPLCWLDYLIGRFPTSENSAYGFYYIGKKR